MCSLPVHNAHKNAKKTSSAPKVVSFVNKTVTEFVFIRSPTIMWCISLKVSVRVCVLLLEDSNMFLNRPVTF